MKQTLLNRLHKWGLNKEKGEATPKSWIWTTRFFDTGIIVNWLFIVYLLLFK